MRIFGLKSQLWLRSMSLRIDVEEIIFETMRIKKINERDYRVIRRLRASPSQSYPNIPRRVRRRDQGQQKD